MSGATYPNDFIAALLKVETVYKVHKHIVSIINGGAINVESIVNPAVPGVNGEYYYSVDSKKLYIGTGTNKTQITDINTFITFTNTTDYTESDVLYTIADNETMIKATAFDSVNGKRYLDGIETPKITDSAAIKNKYNGYILNSNGKLYIYLYGTGVWTEFPSS